MASNSFGTVFRITTWGESHGPAVGVVIDGCPAGIEITVDEINAALALRRPGQAFTSPRKETDRAEILSGVHEGRSTGAPITIIIRNRDADSSKYEATKELYKPGHAQFTYLEKYGCFDYRGGGRASARETACRVAAGAIATKILSDEDIYIAAFLSAIGGIEVGDYTPSSDWGEHELFCPDPMLLPQWKQALHDAHAEGDSLGGVVDGHCWGLPAGLGDPVYEKMEAKLAYAMLSIPASKGFEIGEGFAAARMKGSKHNDGFEQAYGDIVPSSNHAGGTLGGISTGQPIRIRVPFKPTSSIRKAQRTVDMAGREAEFRLAEGSRHDPCVAIRAVPVVQAMLALVLVDCLLMQAFSIQRPSVGSA